MRLLSATAVVLIAAAGPVLAKECRIPNAGPDARSQLPPECRDQVNARQLEAKRKDALRANEGFIDLGNGTQVRMGGRVRAEVLGRH